MSIKSKDDYITVRIGHEAKEKLNQEAERQQRSMSDVVRIILDDFFKKPEV